MAYLAMICITDKNMMREGSSIYQGKVACVLMVKSNIQTGQTVYHEGN